MTNRFWEMSQINRAAAEEYEREAGGLEEIDAAATALRGLIERVRHEVVTAAFNADRFPSEKPLADMPDIPMSGSLSHLSREMAEAEGQAGLKRAQLYLDLQSVEEDLGRLLNRLLMVRVDLHTSQEEF